MQRRCFITSELRPYVMGTKVTRKTSPIYNEENFIKKEHVSPAITIIASEEDGTASYFKKFVQQNGYSVDLMCVEDPSFIDKFTWSTQVDSYQGNYPGIYFRGVASEDAMLNEILAVLDDVLTFYPGVVINRPSRLSLNSSKPLQMSAIAESSSMKVKSIPTFLSNVLTNIRTSHLDDTIVKSISSVRSEVVTLSDKRLLCGEDFLSCPIQMQPKVNGVCIRAHVCGEAVYAVCIDGDGVDYRYGEKLSLTQVKLPQDVELWCVQTARREGLEFAGIDFIYKETSDLYWCLEINPCPGYSFFEQHLVDSGGFPVISTWLLRELLD
ncbi:hypothetical protein U2I54_16565 [Bacillus pseudomycoides]|uniref:ATP-grasp domain-containing protein n=1 Tax=Bacillus bingmayongensis TaxID=1150157 RepID=A0ABU5JYY3_9BACI|nr:hypothetical protein [Bacillus pseudomycoides]